MAFNQLSIGNLVAKLPIIQGGMGIGISLSNLAGAVAAEGGIGVISAAQIGFNYEGFDKNPLATNLRALADHIKKAKDKAINGIIGINIMCAMNNYSEYVKCCVENKVDLIISGAGLPINLPELVQNSATKIAPIVSSLKASKVLLKLWDKRYEKTADMIIIEGSKAGGHLGFSYEEIVEDKNFDEEITEIISFVSTYEEKYNKKIPVVFGGGVFDKKDIEHYLDLGCAGVQIGTRFIATEECDASDDYKNVYTHVKKEDITIVKSPVGMPGRALNNSFVKRSLEGRIQPSRCTRCIEKCNPATTHYCITEALTNAAKGDTENGLFFTGSESYRIDKIATVKELLKELTE